MLTSFQLARGNQLSILGIPSNLSSQKLLDAHIEQTDTKSIHRVPRESAKNKLDSQVIHVEDMI